MWRENLDGERIFVIHDFLSAETCQQLIDRSETLAYETFTVDGLTVGYRNNARVVHVTRFYEPGSGVLCEVRPDCGKALVFDHLVLHEGVAVREGVKYVLRTDVMYGEPAR